MKLFCEMCPGNGEMCAECNRAYELVNVRRQHSQAFSLLVVLGCLAALGLLGAVFFLSKLVK